VIASDGTVRALGVALDRDHVAAGEAITGRVIGCAEPVSVELVRVERRRTWSDAVVVARTRVTDANGAFALEIAADALPTVHGGQCSLAYLVHARADELAAGADVTVTAAPHRGRVDPRAG
jgi:hypothetical protein